MSDARRHESAVERQIREAQERGDFDDLPGAGRPIAGLDQPFTAERWAVDRIRAEGGDIGALLHPLLVLRRERAHFLQTVGDLRSERAVRELVRDFNARLLQQLRRPMDGPLIPVGLLDEEEAVVTWRATRPPSGPGVSSCSSTARSRYQGVSSAVGTGTPAEGARTMPRKRTMTVSDSVVVAADPLTLWNAIADPTQMPRWSPENTGARVRKTPRPLSVGERFSGSNARRWLRWQTRCRVTASEPGKVFEFKVNQIGVIRPFFPVSIARWRYTFEVVPEGTRVTETWFDGRKAWPDGVAKVFDHAATAGDTFADFQRKNIATTLAALKADFARV